MPLYSLSPNTRIESAKLNSNFEGLANGTLLGATSVSATNIDFGGSGAGVWWEEIARTTLGVAGDTITVSSIPARKYLMILYYLNATGGTLNTTLRFNNDSGTNYAHYSAVSQGVGGSNVSQTSAPIESGDTDSGGNSGGTIQVFTNYAAEEKLYKINNISTDAAGGATAPAVHELMGKWANTTDQINRVDIINSSGTGDFAIGSEVIVLGHD